MIRHKVVKSNARSTPEPIGGDMSPSKAPAPPPPPPPLRLGGSTHNSSSHSHSQSHGSTHGQSKDRQAGCCWHKKVFTWCIACHTGASGDACDEGLSGQTQSSIRDMELPNSPPLGAHGGAGSRFSGKGEGCLDQLHLSSGKMFALQALFFWLVLCWPGNMVTIGLYYRAYYSSSATTADSASSLIPSSSLSSLNMTTVSSSDVVRHQCEAALYDQRCQLGGQGECEHLLQAQILSTNASKEEEHWLRVLQAGGLHWELLLQQQLRDRLNCTHLAAVLLQKTYDDESSGSSSITDANSTTDQEDPFSAPDSNITCHESREQFSGLVAWSLFWIQGVSVIAIGLFGIVGNVLTIIVLRKLRTNRNFNNLLTALIVADILLIIDEIVDMSLIGSILLDEPLWYRLAYPYALHPLRGFIQGRQLRTTTIYMVVAVATERYKSVCNPLAQRHKYYKFIVVAVICSMTLEVPRFFEFRLVDNNTDYSTTDLMEDPAYIQLNSYWNELLATGGIPLLCLIYMNTRIYLKIRASSKFAHKFVGRSSSTKGQNNGNLRPPNSAGLRCPSPYNNTMDTANVAGSEEGMNMIGFRRFYHCQRNRPGGRKMATLSECQMHEESTQITQLNNSQLPSPDQNRSNWRKVSKKFMRTKQQSSSQGAASSDDEWHQVGLQQIPERDSEDSHSLRSSTVRTSSHRFVRRRREKSTVILVSIVLIFLVCHTYRLSLRIYELSYPQNNTLEHFRHCRKLGAYHIPVAFYIMAHFHHLFLVINSSVNFIIYCCVGKEFRSKMCQLFSGKSASLHGGD